MPRSESFQVVKPRAARSATTFSRPKPAGTRWMTTTRSTMVRPVRSASSPSARVSPKRTLRPMWTTTFQTRSRATLWLNASSTNKSLVSHLKLTNKPTNIKTNSKTTIYLFENILKKHLKTVYFFINVVRSSFPASFEPPLPNNSANSPKHVHILDHSWP